MADEPITLTTNDILGIVQRGLMELHGYCGQHPQDVDPHVCMQYLERMASFVHKLPTMHVPNGKQPEVATGKAN